MNLNFSATELTAARNGRSWPVQAIKQELNSRLAPETAFAELASLLQFPGGTCLRRKSIVSLAEAAKRQAVNYVEIAPAGEATVNVPPRVIGEGNHRTLTGTTRTLYCAVLTDAMVRGRSQLIERGDYVLLDFEGDEFAGMDDQLELDSAVMCAGATHAMIITHDEPVATVAEAFSLLGPNSFAFGHWIAEYLPRLAVALEWGAMPLIPVLIDAGMPAQHREALQLLLGPSHPLIEIGPWQQLRIGKLWTAPTYYYAPLHPKMNQRYSEEKMLPPPGRFARIAGVMRQRFLANIKPSEPGPGKLFLARRQGGHRQLVNQPAIEAIATAHGFTPVRMETHSFTAQLRLIEQATHLAGPEGSAFFTAFFAKPGKRLCILNHPHTEMLPAVTALLDAVGHHTTVVTGPFAHEDQSYRHFSDYTIDPGDFAAFLAGWAGIP